MNELCPDALKPIVCNMAMDLRKVIGAEKTHRNCVGTAVFPYGKEEKEMDMAALAVRYRELLNRQRETDYVKAMLNRQMEMFDQLDGIDTLEEKRKMLSFFESMIIHTYVISNLGRLRLNDYAQYVESACFYSDDIRGMTINMLSAGGKLTMEVLQGFPETRYIRSFEKTFKPYGLLKVNETVTVTTGKDKSFLTASHQAERYFVKPE